MQIRGRGSVISGATQSEFIITQAVGVIFTEFFETSFLSLLSRVLLCEEKVKTKSREGMTLKVSLTPGSEN